MQHYYQTHSFSTQVLPASLTSIDEVMALSGVHHITISPVLLRQLSEPVETGRSWPSVIHARTGSSVQSKDYVSFKDNEAAFRIAFSRREAGEGEWKLIQVSSSLQVPSTEHQGIVTAPAGNQHIL